MPTGLYIMLVNKLSKTKTSEQLVRTKPEHQQIEAKQMCEYRFYMHEAIGSPGTRGVCFLLSM